jgi:large subunit ribosomal protein L18
MTKLNRTEARLRRHQRVRKNIFGTPEKPRLNVYRSLAEIYAQIIDDEKGHTLVAVSTIEPEVRKKIKKIKKIEQAREVGKLVAERAKEAGIKTVVFDRGGYKYFGRVKALADAARSTGLEF